MSLSFEDTIKIIPRSEWGANEEYRYRDSKEWQNILKKIEDAPKVELSEAEKIKQQKAAQKIKDINAYLVKNYPLGNTLTEKITSENGRPLAWPIEKSIIIKGIVLHHTETEHKTSLEWIQSIYKYHALTRGWWDIGYNFVVWYDGEIFEWRAGWDYTVWAHALYNNRSTIGISVMGNMENHDITDAQLLSLQKLILFLSKKYGIDLSKNIDFHKECKGEKCSWPMNSFSTKSLVWHRDVGFTVCPWEYLYKRLDDFIEYLAPDTKWYTTIKNTKWKIENISSPKTITKQTTEELLTLLWKIEYNIDKSTSESKKQALEKVKSSIVNVLKMRLQPTEKKESVSFEDTKLIKVRLSYPLTGSIDIRNGEKEYIIEAAGTWVLVNSKWQKIVKIGAGKLGFSTITSWERIPEWDSKKMYNDNTFRGNIIVYVKEGKLIVVNEVKLSDYLAWLWEISEWTNEEKAKTILVSARTYARYYMGNIRKYPWELYDGSDNPDEFQRYLWYGLEKRSPNLKKLVEKTKNQYITYNWNIIKPWYFSSSNGKTLSFFDYCIQWGKTEKFCNEEAKKYPYLSSVEDYGGIWKSKFWHGVWISWIWASYFAEKWWTMEMIITYFLKWVRIQKQ
jgi:hypothetical protein